MSILINDSQFNLLSGQIISTGQTIVNSINSLSGFTNNLSRITAINVTGVNLNTGVVNISGLGSVTVLTGNNSTIYVSGASTSLTTLSGNLATTGSNLYNLINSYTGVGLTGRGTVNYTPMFTANGSGVINSNIFRFNDGIALTGSYLYITGIVLPQITTQRYSYIYMDQVTSNLHMRSDTAARTYIGTAGRDILYLDNLATAARYALKANSSPTWGVDLGGTAAGEAFHDLYIQRVVGTGNLWFINNQNITGVMMSGNNISIMPNPLISPRSQLDVSGHMVVRDITGENIRLSNTLVSSGLIVSGNAPVAFNSAGFSGQIAISGNQLLICTGNNLWGRITIAPF